MIFISYSSKNVDKVMPYIDGLKKEFGDDVFFLDTKDIPKGTIFMDVIEKHIEKAQMFIPFITDEYIQSQICMREIAMFDQKSFIEQTRKMVPVCFDDVFNKIPLRYAVINFIKAGDVNKFVDAIKQIKEGTSVKELKPFFENKLYGKETYLNGIAASFRIWDKNISNPKIVIELSKLINWNKYFPNLSKFWENFAITWDGMIGISDVKDNHPILTSNFMGTYFAGEEAKLDLKFQVKTPTSATYVTFEKIKYDLGFVSNNGQMSMSANGIFNKIEVFKNNELAIEVLESSESLPMQAFVVGKINYYAKLISGELKLAPGIYDFKDLEENYFFIRTSPSFSDAGQSLMNIFDEKFLELKKLLN